MAGQHLQSEFSFLWKRKWTTLLATLAGTAIGGVYLWFTPPEYLSVASLVPPSFDDVKSLNFLKIRYMGFGAAEIEDLERVAGALQSDSAFLHLVRKFDLVKHYRLDDVSDEARRYKALKNEYESKVKIRVSSFSTVEISVYDENPQTAADMANELLAYADGFVESVARRKEGIAALETSLRRMEAERRTLIDSLAAIRKRYKVYHLDHLSEAVSQQLLPAFSQNDFHRLYDQVQSTEYRLRYLEEHIADMVNELVFRKENLAVYPSLINVTARAVPAKFKARPKTAWVLGGFAFGSAALTVLAMVYWPWLRGRSNDDK
ncbi:MAG: Wzz/FepE/Etk N-terminal domain-containing protein [Bacteroidia bacterium]|nr:Wzz/FepE/Etk N-terminal domain-containing protein [Bacteroidia bacterium]MDW8333391.1 Wzz/FepE/Etk N-terminal domain-containing protein [Bacteroidia bacterium]